MCSKGNNDSRVQRKTLLNGLLKGNFLQSSKMENVVLNEGFDKNSSIMSLIKNPLGDQLLSGQYAQRFLWSIRCDEL